MGPVGSWGGLEVVQEVQVGVTGPLGSVAGEPDRRHQVPAAAASIIRIRTSLAAASRP
jgi:hypothetical protein